jgi:hypothetical protein
MDTIQLDNADGTTFLGYRNKGIVITPEPVQVGKTSTITLSLQNTGASPIVIRKIEPKVAEYGIGVVWSNLPTIDNPLLLPASPTVKTVSLDWTPTKGGSRCFRAFLHTNYCIHQPLCVGRNLQILEAAAGEDQWHIPFKLGNPKPTSMPVYPVLRGGGSSVTAHILVQETCVVPGEPVWLGPGQEVDGVVLVQAYTSDVIKSAIQVEAVIGQDREFLDGLQVEVYRPAYSLTSGNQRAVDRVTLVA